MSDQDLPKRWRRISSPLLVAIACSACSSQSTASPGPTQPGPAPKTTTEENAQPTASTPVKRARPPSGPPETKSAAMKEHLAPPLPDWVKQLKAGKLMSITRVWGHRDEPQTAIFDQVAISPAGDWAVVIHCPLPELSGEPAALEVTQFIDLQTGRILFEETNGIGTSTRAPMISAFGRRAVTFGGDTLKVWDLPLPFPPSPSKSLDADWKVSAAALSPDGRYSLISPAGQCGEFCLADLDRGTQTRFRNAHLNCARYSGHRVDVVFRSVA